MANILRDELIENNYVSTNNIDNELPPTHVVLYLKNISGIDKKTVIEPIPLQQVLLNNQNPSLKLIDNKAIFCLSPPSLLECIPIVNEVSCLCLDTTENYKVTVDNETFSGSFEDVVSFLASHGLYAYPSKTKCNPAPTISCDGATTEAWFTNGSGAFHITVNGEFFENTNNWGVGYMINQIPELAAILYGEGGSGFRFFNKSPKFLRIKLEPIQSDVWGIKAENNNPTIDINDDGVIQFCLCPDTPPQTTLLRLQTSDVNTLFSGVADNLTLINSANQIVYRN